MPSGALSRSRGGDICDLIEHPSYAKCAACGACFTSDSAFDRHQRANYRAKRRENVVRCLDPAEVKRGEQGLTFDRAVGAWRWERTGEGRQARRLEPPVRLSSDATEAA